MTRFQITGRGSLRSGRRARKGCAVGVDAVGGLASAPTFTFAGIARRATTTSSNRLLLGTVIGDECTVASVVIGTVIVIVIGIVTVTALPARVVSFRLRRR